MHDRAVRSVGTSSDSSFATASGRPTACLVPANRRTALHPASTGQWLHRCLMAICCSFGLAGGSVQAIDPDNILLDFSATWCGPCQQMSPIVSKLERQGFPIRKVDIDQEAALARQYHVEEIPCFVLVANGREINRLTGRRSERELRQLMDMLPKQNIDDAVFGKPARNNATAIPVTNSTTKSSDEKKPFVKLFTRTQDAKNSDTRLTPTEPDTIRGQTPSLEATSDSNSRELLLVSTRIRVNDGSRTHYGSGTVIESQPGRSVILTCGHIFRDLSNDATIEVDVFNGANAKPQTILGQVLSVDPKADVGLLVITPERRLPTIRLCSAKNGPAPKDRVVSIGCGGGQRPTCEDLVVTGINKFTGPDNIECTGVPQQGRSGGGLFLGSELVGVCIAADPGEKRGIYTALKPVAELLAKVSLGHLAQSYLPAEELAAASESTPSRAAAGPKQASLRRNDDDMAALMEAAMGGSGNGSAASPDLVGAEIVCIVRPKTPGGISRVVIVNQASSRFVDDLLHESGGSRQESTTAVRTKSEKQPSVESGRASSRLAMQKVSLSDTTSNESSRPIETSFEQPRYRRNRD